MYYVYEIDLIDSDLSRFDFL